MEERRILKEDLTKSFSKRDSEQLLKVESKLGNVLEQIRRKETQFVKEAAIIGTTLTKAAIDEAIYKKRVDVVMIDEASMAYVPQAAFAASLGKRVIVCGDFKQLPPIASSKHPLVSKWLREDVFHCSGIVENVKNEKLHPQLFLLNEQRRMHPVISAFTNDKIYHSLVGDHPKTKKWRQPITDCAPFQGQASILLDTSHTGRFCFTGRSSKSRMNLWQLLLSFQAIQEALHDGIKSIGYVTPYRAQAKMMNLLFEDLLSKEREQADILAATVHRFQGSERDMMVFDSVDGEPEYRAGMLLTGENSERLINVAMTRTKGKFLHVSNVDYVRKKVSKGKTFRQLVDHQITESELISPAQIGKWVKHQNEELRFSHAMKTAHVFKDIANAKEIILSIPEGATLTDEWIETINKSNGKLTVISPILLHSLPLAKHIDLSLSFPFVALDRNILWLGVPFEAMKGTLPPAVSMRLQSRLVTGEFLNQIGTFES
ncbi:DEAD/DEAH box helicase [Pseudalkalibacillus hwajinpoensis]|uniref:DEAD/DEAH box helicase n=1 Tax=Guptibacillus hwajinpoensis TaxID=208199 RepID=UPI00325B6A42